jgi:predicted TIM-barrel fold metal-dependent hydrolase
VNKTIIDIHTRIGRHPIHEFKQKPSELLKIMDKHGIAKSFLQPFPTMKIKENNDLIAGAVKENPDRFIGFAGINPVADDAQEELDRVIGLGFKGLMIDPEFHKASFRRLAKVEELMVSCVYNKMPVLLNTENITTQTRQKPFYVSLDTLAFKFPSVRFIVSFRWPRIDELMRIHENIYLYTGGHHNTPGIIPLLQEVGPLRICMGTESPVNHPGLTIMDLGYKKIPEKYRELILGKNAERIFKDLI